MKIYQKSIIILLLTTVIYATQNFSKSKKLLLKKVYFDNKLTFYCDNPYKIKQIKGREKTVIIPNKFKYAPRNRITKRGKINPRAKRVEWEHIVPAHHFGKELPCWYKGDKRCVNKRGKLYKGRRCCRKVSQKFRDMEGDMMNLVPAIGEINGDRSNFKFEETDNSLQGQYGACNFRVDFKKRKVYPANYTKGFIGRTYLYFLDKYNLKETHHHKKLFYKWNKIYPKTEWEKIRERRIQEIRKGRGL